MSTAPSPNDNLLTDFVTGVEVELRSSAEDRQGIGTWGPVSRPEEAPEEAGNPPASFDQPVWSRPHGWIDKSDLTYEPMVWADPSETE